MPSPSPVRRRVSLSARRRAITATVLVLACLATTTAAAVTPSAAAPAAAAAWPVYQWLNQPLIQIAHRGGSADWPEASPLAYQKAEAWSPDLALEFPARRTSDGVWVASEDATTGRVFGQDLTIATSTWAQLSVLRSTVGNQPMSRLKQTLLKKLPTSRILFVDDKADAYVDQLLDLLDKFGGRTRTIIKSYWQFTNTPAEAHHRGYLTWGYYYPDQLADFAATQGKFDLLGMSYSAPASAFNTLLATGKRVIAHVVATDPQADAGLDNGATGLMVSGVTAVVPRG